MFLLPVIPFITDTAELLEESVSRAKEAGVDFIIFGGMTLKEGRQQEYFYNALRKTHPELIAEYQSIYRGSKWGEATKEYYDLINRRFSIIARKYRMPKRIPPSIYRDILDREDLVMVMLEHIDYLLKLEGKPSSFGYAAYSISQLKEPLSTLKGEFRKIKGVNQAIEPVILEILETGSSSYYENLMAG
jgi:hypothetical protein